MEDRVYPSQNNGGGGYKGFSHSYPLQQPESPPPRRGRGRRCCKFCCFALLGIVVLLIIGAALVYFLMKPKALKYSVQEATVTTFNLTSQNRLTTNIKFVIVANNPNKDVEFFFSNGTVEASFKDAEIGDGAIPAFQQLRKSKVSFPVVVLGRDIALHGSAASNLKKDLAADRGITLELKAKTHVKVKTGSLKSWKQKVKISCDITMVIPSKSGKAQISSSTCKIKKP